VPLVCFFIFLRVNRHIEVLISGVHADMYPIVAPLELRAAIALFSPSNLFYTDGSLVAGVAGFAVHHSIDCNIGFWIRRPVSVFTAELAAVRMGMEHIENEALGRYLILTDCMSSIKAMESRKSRYLPIRSCTSVNKNVGNWHEVPVQ
jgi:hypothetical protein